MGKNRGFAQRTEEWEAEEEGYYLDSYRRAMVFVWHSYAVAVSFLNVTPIYAQFSNGSSGDWLPAILLIYGLVWLLVLATVLQNTDFDPVTKLTWVIVIIFVPFLGVILYWAIAPSNPKNSPKEFSLGKKNTDPANQIAGTPWENDPGYSPKSK